MRYRDYATINVLPHYPPLPPRDNFDLKCWPHTWGFDLDLRSKYTALITCFDVCNCLGLKNPLLTRGFEHRIFDLSTVSLTPPGGGVSQRIDRCIMHKLKMLATVAIHRRKWLKHAAYTNSKYAQLIDTLIDAKYNLVDNGFLSCGC